MRNNKSITAILAVMTMAAALLLVLSPTQMSASGPGATYFTNTPLVTQNGNTVHFYDDLLKGKSVVINFIYTECGDSCPLETAKLAQVQRLLGERVGKDIFFYSISIDPKRDSPQALKAYAKKFHAGPGWFFLTGKKEDIEVIRKKLGQAAGPDQNELTDHSTSLVIGDEPTGQWMRDSSMDDARSIATMVADWLSSWRNHKGGQSYEQATRNDAPSTDRGAYLFKSRCSACHTVGGGDSIGPDLRGVTAVRDHEWLSRFIQAPDKVLAAKDPIATALLKKYNGVTMPNLRLGKVDAEALMEYLRKTSNADEASAAPAANAGGRNR
ncbi:MAG TPA: SCO family protein [Candidatus Angelobacter sp.]|jgi:protein SCO1/2|nr:SCO family protein [Candidatus Angelobacter sp.]